MRCKVTVPAKDSSGSTHYGACNQDAPCLVHGSQPRWSDHPLLRELNESPAVRAFSERTSDQMGTLGAASDGSSDGDGRERTSDQMGTLGAASDGSSDGDGRDGRATKWALSGAAAVSEPCPSGCEPNSCEPVEVVHACPPEDHALMPCCRRAPFEVPDTDRIAAPAQAHLVTCRGGTVTRIGYVTKVEYPCGCRGAAPPLVTVMCDPHKSDPLASPLIQVTPASKA